MSQDAEMAGIASTLPPFKSSKSHVLFTSTLRSPAFAYTHLEMMTDTPGTVELDDLQVRSYITAALRQFLGDHGAAVAADILKVDGRECWLRLPRQDLGLFSAAITAFPGTSVGGGSGVLRLLACGDWLGSLVGRADEKRLWTS